MDVLLVLTDPEEDQLQNAHVQMELTPMIKEDVKYVPLNVSLVTEMPITVPYVILLVKELLEVNPTVHVSMVTSKNTNNVSFVTTDVLLVIDMKETVSGVSTPTELQLQTVSVLMDSTTNLMSQNVTDAQINV